MADVLEWFRDNTDVSVHDGVSVEHSDPNDEVKGFGLFLDKNSISLNEDLIELLRIPKKHTYNIDTILELINDETNYSSNEQYEITTSAIKEYFSNFTVYLENANVLMYILNENNILAFYFILFELLIENGYELPKVITFYLQNVLMTTSVFHKDIVESNLMLEYFGHYGTPIILNDVIGYFNYYFDNIENIKKITKDTIKQLYFAILSRCLEIPEEIRSSPTSVSANKSSDDGGDDNDDDDDDDDDDLDEEGNGDDFVVNSTLVPLLDFCNHSNDLQNAHFDVDRFTGDVLLMIDLKKYKNLHAKKIHKDTKFEIYISYSPKEEIFTFLNSYGFIPDSKVHGCQYYNLSLDRNFLKTFKLSNGLQLGLFYKWFSIKPIIQLVKEEDQWNIYDGVPWERNPQFLETILPFVSINANKNQVVWSYNEKSSKSFAYMHQIINDGSKDDLGDLVSAYRDFIFLKENDLYVDRIGLPQLAWTLETTIQPADEIVSEILATKIKSRPSLRESMDQILIDGIVNVDTRFSFLSFLNDYAKWRIQKLQDCKIKISPSSNPILQYINFESSVLKQLQKNIQMNYT
ncbi:hypothetical protein Kpol_530p1, partial [Vanderwaltozyma polyspora DSM 70294]